MTRRRRSAPATSPARQRGVLVKRFDGECPERFAYELFPYLSMDPREMPVAAKMFERPKMTREVFDELADGFRSPHLWRWEGDSWVLRHPVRHESEGP